MVKRDEASLNKMKANKELELINAEEAIEDYLGRPEVGLDEQFIALVDKKESIKKLLTQIEEIKKEYL